jgi:hypothetical protein
VEFVQNSTDRWTEQVANLDKLKQWITAAVITAKPEIAKVGYRVDTGRAAK